MEFIQKGSEFIRKGADIELSVKLDSAEHVPDAETEICIQRYTRCDVCDGSGAEPGSPTHLCSTCDGSGQTRRETNTPFGAFSQITVCSTCHGAGRTIPVECKVCEKGRVIKSKTLIVRLPENVEKAKRLRLREQGDAGEFGALSGDLYIQLIR